MMARSLSFVACLVLLMGALPARAMETDQFNLSPTPLVDIAPEVEAYVAVNIQAAVDKLNGDIALHEACLTEAERRAMHKEDRETATQTPARCSSAEKERAKLDVLRSPAAVAKAVYDRLGAGSIFITKTGKWLNSHRFHAEPSRYKAAYTESIYWTYPVDYATLSPTIRMYGVEFGTDKLDHLFQQGFKYYSIYQNERSAGKTDADALKAMVSWGRSTENLFFGYAVSGVYSNADLAANLAGLKFYQNLTQDLNLGGTARKPLLSLRDGKWLLTRTWVVDGVDSESGILRPLISDHLNEALNPSNYLFWLYPIVRKMVKDHDCGAWRENFPGATRQQFLNKTAALKTWNGLDYGYKQTSRQPNLAELCFGKEIAVAGADFR